jgi:hypothetical protein
LWSEVVTGNKLLAGVVGSHLSKNKKIFLEKSSAGHEFITLVINDLSGTSGMPYAGRGIRYFIICEIRDKRVRVAKLCAECTPYTPFLLFRRNEKPAPDLQQPRCIWFFIGFEVN